MKDTNQDIPRTTIRMYSEQFKREVIAEYIVSGSSKLSIQKKYNIAAASAICNWMRQYGYEDIHLKRCYIEGSNHNELKKKKPVKQAHETEDVAALKKQIEELKHELENEKLRNEAYILTIEIAEKELNIPIRKKRSTK